MSHRSVLKSGCLQSIVPKHTYRKLGKNKTECSVRKDGLRHSTPASSGEVLQLSRSWYQTAPESKTSEGRAGAQWTKVLFSNKSRFWILSTEVGPLCFIKSLHQCLSKWSPKTSRDPTFFASQISLMSDNIFRDQPLRCGEKNMIWSACFLNMPIKTANPLFTCVKNEP